VTAFDRQNMINYHKINVNFAAVFNR